jgi:23S rRNA (pseudouridine1915-N3)-methyltransferase
MKMHLLAVGKAKGSFAELCAEYQKRMAVPFAIRELSGVTPKAEGEALCAAIPKDSLVVLMDEHGKDLSSVELAAKMAQWQESGKQNLIFVIGGADGLTPDVREKGDFVLGLGRKTWPHMLARVMLIEQIYRAQQINAGHPYHRA